ncbi:class I SAM-dependent methyltransferase [Laspinema sp. D1]|uniref:Class I SAM-dependent methyltransferase n=1 Tax=Laspinema palackyanum D2a TaxID=2953684 RepID=A0ABT2MMI9_9CYAN|nr:class I SAM-dependent methyltransferase [Laspinema sp. D2a]
MKCPLCHSESKPVFNTEYAKVNQCLNISCKHKFNTESLPRGGVMDYSGADDFSIYRQRNLEMIDYLLNQGYLNTQAKVLDLGCGEGHIAQTFSDRKFDVTCVELSSSARKILDQRGLVNYPTTQDIPPDIRFDLILMIEVIEHLKSPVSVIKEAKNRLTDKGIIFVTTPCADGLKARLFPEKSEAYQEPTHLHFFSSQSLNSCFQIAGFSEFQRFYLPWIIPNRSPVLKTLDKLLYGIDLNSHLTYFLFNS